jgi:hypothetical protein
LTLLTDGNGKTSSTVATMGENPSAKGRLPEVDLLTKIPLIYYKNGNLEPFKGEQLAKKQNSTKIPFY